MSRTTKANLVKRAEGFGGRARHYQVVYRMLNQREDWTTTLEAGDVFRPTLLQRARKFVVYEVSDEPEHRLDFSERFVTLDELHDFTLDFKLAYRVAGADGARTLVESRSLDPLRKLEKHAAEWVGGVARHLPWEVLWEGGSKFQSAILGDYETSGQWTDTKQRLSEKAAAWGLEILDLRVARVLPPNAVSPDETQQVSKAKKTQAKVAELHQDAKVERVQKKLAHEQAEVDLDRDMRLKANGSIENVIDMMQKMIDRAGSRVDTFPEMVRAVRQLQEVRQEVALLTQPMSSGASPLDGGQPTFPAMPSTPMRELGPARPNHGLAQLLDNIQLHLSDLSEDVQRDVLSPIFRLLAELVRGSEGDEETIEELRETIDEGLGEYLSQLDGQQIDAIRRLADVPSLRKKLARGKKK